MELNFWKMEGLGNDFIVLDDRDEAIVNYIPYSDLAIRLCDRHFGIGGDGIILARKSLTHDIRFVIINSDGTEPQMCGNGMRCFAKFLYEKGILVKQEMRVETLAGTVIPGVSLDDAGRVTSVRVDMGPPELVPANIPFVCDREKAIQEIVETDQGPVSVTCVSMGNPHAVTFVEDLDPVDVKKTGRAVECHDRFPEKTNVEFIRVISDSELEMKVWERGRGSPLPAAPGPAPALWRPISPAEPVGGL